ncbi:MAG: PQQ-binding-like beta-propeller repeat protein, partial [Ilumatobacteraceae bacterium]
IGRLRIGAVASLAVALLGACGDSDGDSGGASPSPDEMCEVGQVPQAAAYDLDDGSFRWASCADGNAYRSVRAVTDDAVYVEEVGGTAQGDTIALDPADGSVLADAPELPPGARVPTGPIEVDGLTVSGGQDDPVAVRGANGESWTQPGTWAYDNVWAIDDDAVFAVERGNGFDSSRLVAYELATGDIRWEYVGDPYAEGLWPWHAEEGRLFTVWNNLQVRDTGSGDLLWKTSYPPSQNPDLRMAGVDADDEAVYVGFGSAASGGD